MFGVRVRLHRQRLGLSQEELAAKAGVDPKTLRDIESGRRKPRPVTLRCLADALGLRGPEHERFCVSAVPQEVARVQDRGTVPAQLPPGVPAFTGRRAELDQLDELLPGSGRARPAARIVVVSGTAGVGKSTLATHWAHRMASRFPDGQLYLNLRGFEPSGRVMAAGEAIRTLLEGLGVGAERLPISTDAQIGRYRSQLAGRRILVVLDDARDADQVRPLLPGTPASLVVVTSRDLLTPLVAREGAHRLTLSLLSNVEAEELLADRLGDELVKTDHDAVDTIIAACARLPLALVITAARAQQTGFPLATIAGELRDGPRRLDALEAGDESSSIRSVFSWSYTTLTPAARGLFRLLGLHSGPDISVAVAASLSGAGPEQARRLLHELVHANLLSEHLPDRYNQHDLLRAYAIDLIDSAEAESVRRAAGRRLLDHYTHTAHAADRLLNPLRDQSELPLGDPADGAVVADLADDRQARQWFDAELANLLAVQQQAGAGGSDTHAWQLAWALDTYLIRRGLRQDLACVWQIALQAASRLRDLPEARAQAHRAMATVHIELMQYGEASRHAHQALDLYAGTGDRVGQAYTHRKLAYLNWRQGDPREALRHAQHALGLFRAAGHQRGVANELNGVGWYQIESGNHAEALRYCQEALERLLQLDDQIGAAYTWDSLGYAHHHLGHHAEAIDCYQQALALHSRLGDRHDQADTLHRLGDTHSMTGDIDAARAAWGQALDILTDLELDAAATVLDKLDGCR